ncbi:hypothetical protein DYI95_004365 [Thermaerobacter sp. PB12/4term]|uniref:hypothetical protein n=1 Tax=Thermaerobacter sp. PB12/4term TaxID=2293838 RepID=UPI000E3289FD|nr:hypothetical protein [Thermaerobacter sp. PB12/4term]QIA26850.1 hypothetical protein DYI95_004365 [Thermaerobacter sp. PB12/4term]
MPGTPAVTVALSEREMALLRNVADFAGFGCDIHAVEVEPAVEPQELEELVDTLDAAMEAGEAPVLTRRQLEVAFGLLDYQQWQCPLATWCEVDDATQDELDALREKIQEALT